METLKEKWNSSAKNYSNILNSKSIFSEFGDLTFDLTMGKKPIDRSIKVLDVACGSGALSINLAKRIAPAGGKVTAVDLSNEMLDRLHLEIERENVNNIETRIENGEALTLPSNQFDFAYSSFGVMLFQNKQAGINEIYRVLKPGGKGAIVSMSRTWCFFPMLKDLMNEMGVVGDIPEEVYQRVTIPEESDLRSMFESSGFKSVEVHKIHGVRNINMQDIQYLAITNPLFLMAAEMTIPKEKHSEIIPSIKKIVDPTKSDTYPFGGEVFISFGTK